MIHAAIFDVDGVLLDTVPYHFSAWQKMFAEEGVPLTFANYLEKLNGLPRLTGITNVLGNRPKEYLEELAQKKQNYYLTLVAQNPPKPLEGVVELFALLSTKGILLAAASSSKNAPLLLEKAGLSSSLVTIVGGSDFSLPKPNPDIFLTASKRLGVEPSHCIVFEDAASGIQAAKTAGMKTIGLLTSHDLAIPKLAGKTVLSLANPQEIMDFIETL